MAGLRAAALNIEACVSGGAARPFLDVWSDRGLSSEIARTLEHVATTYPCLHTSEIDRIVLRQEASAKDSAEAASAESGPEQKH